LPLNKITIAGWLNSDYMDIIKNELNINNVEIIDNISSVADSFVYLITPKIGARLGSELGKIIPAVKQGNYKQDGDKLLVAGNWLLNSDEFEIRLTVKDTITGAALPDNTAVVVLDTELTPELLAEGLANDALRFIQDTRKEIDLDVSDRITLEYSADSELSAAIETHRDSLMKNALITDMKPGVGEHSTEIEGYKLSIKITKQGA
jgi:isoleucyl-tRNA synthetase